jgi:hypothetical protein
MWILLFALAFATATLYAAGAPPTDSDPSTRKVLGNLRLNGFEVHAKGHHTSAGKFLIDPLSSHAMMVRKGNDLKLVTYFCDVCSPRAYTPGPCVCWEKETVRDLRDPAEIDKQ